MLYFLNRFSVIMGIGLFSVKGGTFEEPSYEIGSPIFDKLTIHLDDRYYGGKQFIVEANSNSAENVCVQSANLDGQILKDPC